MSGAAAAAVSERCHKPYTSRPHRFLGGTLGVAAAVHPASHPAPPCQAAVALGGTITRFAPAPGGLSSHVRL